MKRSPVVDPVSSQILDFADLTKPTALIYHLIYRVEAEAVVDEVITPYNTGRVYFQSSWWPAICLQAVTVHPGQRVLVKGRYHLTLIVETASLIVPASSSGRL